MPMCAWIGGGQRTIEGVLFRICPAPLIQDFSLAWNSLIRLDRLVREPPNPPISASPELRLQVYTTIWVFHMGSGIKLRFSSLGGKLFAY